MADLLYEYGIQTEDSTHHLHIDVYTNTAFVFPTSDGVNALPEPIIPATDEDWECSGYYVIYPEWANGQPTARGIRIHHEDIRNCRMIPIPSILSPLSTCSLKTTSEKGRFAEHVGKVMLDSGMIPITLDASLIEVKDMQITGIDIYCQPVKIEIKFDYNCLNRGIFLQTHERNHYKQF